MDDSAREFERYVAELYRVSGADVAHDTHLAGSQIDVLVREPTSSGSRVVRVVECKAYSSPVGISVVRLFASLVDLLRSRGLADVATIVASNGFTATARRAANDFNIELLEITDLEHRLTPADSSARIAEPPVVAGSPDGEAHESGVRHPIRIFVVMPFTPEMDDLYLLGIREVAEKLGMIVERADEVLHNSSIIDVVQDRIDRADIVVADTTHQNPNVYYELGFAHGRDKAVILIARKGTDLPFDIRGFNHIIYDSIHDLRTRLRSYLEQRGQS